MSDNCPVDRLKTGDNLMRQRRWAEAADAFARSPGPDAGTDLKRRLSANLGSLQQYRPDVYATLVSLPAQQQFSVATTTTGAATVLCRRDDGSSVSLSPGNDPEASAAAAKRQLYAATKAGESVGLCGIGDGYLARVLAQEPPVLFMDKQQPVFLVEPEAQIVLQCLMIHDYTGRRGPIEDARFHWFVGEQWDEQYQRTLTEDLYLPVASLTVGQGYDTPRIQERLRAIVQRLVDRDAEFATEIGRYYDELGAADFAAAFAGRADRPPRVLLLTTRFSTVLQYSTRDTAAAFERMGWQARLVIEPSSHHRVLRSGIAAALAEFKPDLVFQIDHLRHEHQGLFPPNLPFACWIQDHLPHLASPEVGRRVGEFDFVLTDAIDTYVDKFAYPALQCIPLPKLVVQAEPAEAGDEPADDLVFVSNASRTADAMIEEALARHARNAHTEELVKRCCRRMVETYESGGALPTYHDVCAVLNGTLTDLGLTLAPDGFDVLARWLTHPFNDALYRQQALRWAAEAASEHGLTLALYGKGWESHPEFRPHARGPVAYGEPLRRLTRQSRINLQIVPYLCLHQRLLDGLMAGGFFLVRTHPADLAPAALLRFLEDSGAGTARTTADALADLPPMKQQELQTLIAQCRPCLCTTGAEDVVAMTRAWEEAGQLTVRDGPVPMLSEVGFHDVASLKARVRKFAGASSLRESVAGCQRRSVSARLTYDSGVRRVAGRIGELLADSAVRAAGREAIVTKLPATWPRGKAA